MMQQSRSNSYLFGGNAPYVEEMYENYLDNPGSVPDNWRTYFDALQNVPAVDGSNARDVPHLPVVNAFAERAKAAPRHKASGADSEVGRKRHVQQLIAAYRNVGSRWADLDPLKRSERPKIPELEPSFYGFSDADLETVFNTSNTFFDAEQMTLRDLCSAARDLLRHDRRRVHVHHRPGREALVAGSSKASAASPTSPTEKKPTSSTASPRPRAWSASCTPSTSARSASRSKAAKASSPRWTN